MKARLIINPISGTQSKEGLSDKVKAALSPAGWEIDTVFTRCHGDATRLAAEAAAQGFEAVIAAGGDGTVNETAAALCDTPTALGLIPCGSGNGLARHLNIPVDIDESLRILASEQPRKIDYATVEAAEGDRVKFFCTFGVGFDAAVSEAFARQPRRGKLTYLKTTFQTFASFEPEEYVITAGGIVVSERALLVAVCNASQYGNNAYIAPGAKIDDGMLDVTIIHAGSPLSAALVGFDLLVGNLGKNLHYHTFRTPSITISRRSPGVAHADGEPIDLPAELKIDCHPSAINVFAPRNVGPVKPFVTPVMAAMTDLRLAVNKIIRRAEHRFTELTEKS
ncbi:MAG: diacylglycerol kinase family lipid kinase [Duncaniella sp.]|nr:diacylglycerol kinase family lipid kinase [Duncaniella sp.]